MCRDYKRDARIIEQEWLDNYYHENFIKHAIISAIVGGGVLVLFAILSNVAP